MSRRRLIPAAALVGAAAAASAFALGGTGRAQGEGLPGCVHPHGRAAVPASLARFPLPRGTVLDRRHVEYGYAVYSGYVPGAINPVRDFLVGRLPEVVQCATVTGSADWKVRAVAGCPGALTIQIAVR